MPLSLTLYDDRNLIFVFCIYRDLAQFLTVRGDNVLYTIEPRLNQLTCGLIKSGPDTAAFLANKLCFAGEHFEQPRRFAGIAGETKVRPSLTDWEKIAKGAVNSAA